MLIHKSKGLEFDTVAVLGVERESFFGNQDEQRSAYFVAISRAKRRLVLSVSNRREWPEGARLGMLVGPSTRSLSNTRKLQPELQCRQAKLRLSLLTGSTCGQ